MFSIYIFLCNFYSSTGLIFDNTLSFATAMQMKFIAIQDDVGTIKLC